MRRYLILHHADFWCSHWLHWRRRLQLQLRWLLLPVTTPVEATAHRDETLNSLTALRLQIGQVEAELAATDLVVTRERLQEDNVLLHNLRRFSHEASCKQLLLVLQVLISPSPGTAHR
jgi:hypothetical protein